MKILRKMMLIFSAVLLTAACSKSDIEEIEPNVPSKGVMKTLNLTVPDMVGETRATAAASADEKKIANVWVLQYSKDGSIMGTAQYLDGNKINATTGKVTVQLSDAESTICVVANVGNTYAAFANNAYPKTLGAFEELTHTFSSVVTVGSGKTLPMVGSKKISASDSEATVELKRLVAKIAFKVTIENNTETSTLKLTSAQLEYVSNKTTFNAAAAGANRVQPAAADGNFFNKATKFVYDAKTISVATGASSAELVWYVPENLAGEVSSITDAKDKGPGKAPAYSTRIAVKGTATVGGHANSDVTLYIYPGANEKTSFNIERNKVYSVTSTIKRVQTSDTRLVAYENLTPTGAKTANCYMIHGGGHYKFSCTVMGNGAAASVDNSGVNTATLAPASVAVVWQSTDGVEKTGTVVKKAELENGFIKIDMAEPFKEGNALIAAKDASGKILWSWHIWATAYNPDLQYDTYQIDKTGLGLADARTSEKVMRCNLGAIMQGSTGYAAQSNLAYASGLLYQWGRKDPFVRKDITPTASGTIALSIEHPDNFYKGDNNNWFTGAVKNDLWGNGGTSFAQPSVIHGTTASARSCNKARGTKSKFDPCPAGWRVAPQYLWTKVVTLKTQSGGSPVYLTLNNGSCDRSTAAYPAAGYLDCSSGKLAGATASGYCWSSSPYSGSASEAHAGYLHFIGGNVYPLYDYNRGYGFSVRCVQE